jgi:hypothetical protein
MITYTVYSGDTGTVAGRGLTAEAAADLRLTHDGARYELRRESADYDVAGEGAWQIYGPTARGRGEWVPYSSGPAPHGKLLRAYGVTAAAAWAAIAPMVLTADWQFGLSGDLTVMTDADYDAMMAAVAADE